MSLVQMVLTPEQEQVLLEMVNNRNLRWEFAHPPSHQEVVLITNTADIRIKRTRVQGHWLYIMTVLDTTQDGLQMFKEMFTPNPKKIKYGFRPVMYSSINSLFERVVNIAKSNKRRGEG